MATESLIVKNDENIYPFAQAMKINQRPKKLTAGMTFLFLLTAARFLVCWVRTAGKTTTLRCIDLIKPDKGEIIVDGIDI